MPLNMGVQIMFNRKGASMAKYHTDQEAAAGKAECYHSDPGIKSRVRVRVALGFSYISFSVGAVGCVKEDTTNLGLF